MGCPLNEPLTDPANRASIAGESSRVATNQPNGAFEIRATMG